jgi:benzoylformate decarboxylase
MNVAAALMAMMRSAGVSHLFGNPGTTELPFLDALDGSGLEYVLALQEATAVAAADGYAQASGRVAVVNLHVAPGLGNGLAIIQNAARARSPVVVTAGQQDSRLLLDEPILAGDMVQMTEQFTKWSHEVRTPAEALTAMRRALTLARTAPTGPVFLSLPMDVMVDAADDPGSHGFDPPSAAMPEPEALRRAAALLGAARAPLIIAGDGVARAGAVDDLVAVAEALGAPVYGEPIFRRTNFPGDHPLWRGGMFPTPAGVRKALEPSDAVLIVGANVFAWFLHTPGRPFRDGLAVVQVDDDPWEIGKSHAVTLGIVADPGAAVRALRTALGGHVSAAARAAAAERMAAATRTRAEYVRRLHAEADAQAGQMPVSPAYLMRTLAALVDDDTAIVDESASSLPHVLRHFKFPARGAFFGSKTGTLGWGMGAAIGVQLARPGRKVVATIGDGGLMYAPQALWTAAHYRLPITYVVPNNASYAILKSGMLSLGLPGAKRGIFPGMDITQPEIDYVALARALGVTAMRVDTPSALGDVLRSALASDGPTLVEVPIDRGFKAMM